MPRAIDAGLASALLLTTSTLAICVKVELQNGTVLGFTSNNSTLTVDGDDYVPSDSLRPTAISSHSDTSVDNLSVIGDVGGSSVTEADLAAGLYDDAEVTIFLVDWSDVSLGKMILFSGRFGGIVILDGKYKAELLGKSNQLKQVIGSTTQPLCRVKRFGDAQCKASVVVDIYTVLSVSSDGRTITFTSAKATGYYNYGILRATSGAANGLEAEIKSFTNGSPSTVVLRSAFGPTLQVGDTVEAERGCDRTFATCSSVFSNSVNFHGEPALPGNMNMIKTGRAPS